MNQTSIFDKRIGLYYSPIAAIGDIGVSLDTFKRIAGVGSSAQIPYSSVKIKITSPDQAASIGNYLRNQISNSTFDNVWNYSELKSTIDRIQNLLDNILIILLVVVLIISFFSLVTTSYLNIINQTN